MTVKIYLSTKTGFTSRTFTVCLSEQQLNIFFKTSSFFVSALSNICIPLRSSSSQIFYYRHCMKPMTKTFIHSISVTHGWNYSEKKLSLSLGPNQRLRPLHCVDLILLPCDPIVPKVCPRSLPLSTSPWGNPHSHLRCRSITP